MALKVITAPAIEPVTLAEAKLHLRVDGTTDDTLISGLIQTAREHIEAVILNRALITQTLEYVISAFPDEGGSIQLPRPPLQSITSIKYTDSANVEATLASTEYVSNIDISPGIVMPAYGKTWPTTVLKPTGGIRIRYVAGYGLAAAVPESFKSAIKLLVGHLYEHRESVIVSGAMPQEIPMAVDSLCADRCFMNMED